jgi:ubiquinone/menaquinone biosynthesis C-methylase UbiE
MQSFCAQFEYPRGFLGWLVGLLMAVENRERNAWAVTMLNLQPVDSVLEIGFGPGLAVQQASNVARFVAGIDRSAVMVQQASKRNARAIRAGRVELRQGAAQKLPYPSATFDKVFAVNSLHSWSDQAAGLAEVQRVLKPLGNGDSGEAGRKTVALLTEVGFRRISVTEK